MTTLRRKLQRAMRAALRAERVPAVMGAYIGGTATVNAERPGRVYATIQDGEQRTIVVALNHSAPLKFGLPIWLERGDSGEWEVVGVDAMRATEFFGDGTPTNFVGPHSHEPGTGLDDFVSPERFYPGLCVPETGTDLTVYVYPFSYTHEGAEGTWQGGTLDLTAYVPATEGEHGWVKVYYNLDTGALGAVAGDTYDLLLDIGQTVKANRWDYLDAIATAGYVPLMAVRLRNGQTALNNPFDFQSIREFVTGGGALTAASVTTDTSNFDGLLSGADTTVQAALDTLDDVSIPSPNFYVETLAEILAETPTANDMAYATDTGYLLIADGSQWLESGVKFNVRSSIDMGAELDSSQEGYHTDYLTDKSLFNVKLLGNVDMDEAGDIQLNTGVTPSLLEMFANGIINYIPLDIAYLEQDYTHTPVGEKISIRSGNSQLLGLNGLPVVREYQTDMGAYPAPVYVDGGTF